MTQRGDRFLRRCLLAIFALLPLLLFGWAYAGDIERFLMNFVGH